MAETVEYLVSRGIPVLAHVGLMPQYVNTMGGYLAQGKTPDSAARILADALALEKAGAFGVVLEGVTEALGADITAKLHIPTIGIGASPACDGQILVTDDMLGLSGNRVPKFVKRYADLDTVMRNAVQQYADEVRGGKFPEAQHCFGVKRT
jgi:3-methyl-2-oxobutanoate hydroxymethyltransferase